MQIARFGEPIGFGQRHAPCCLLQIDAAPYTRLHAAFQAAVDIGMGRIVVARQGHEFPVPTHVDVGADHFQCELVTGRKQLVIRGQARVTQSTHVRAGGKPVKQHLAQLQRGC